MTSTITTAINFYELNHIIVKPAYSAFLLLYSVSKALYSSPTNNAGINTCLYIKKHDEVLAH